MTVSLVRHCVDDAVRRLMERFLYMCRTASEWQRSNRGVVSTLIVRRGGGTISLGWIIRYSEPMNLPNIHLALSQRMVDIDKFATSDRPAEDLVGWGLANRS